VGRAPGGDQATARALGRYLAGGVDTFVQDVVELMAYFRNTSGGVKAIPGQGLNVPIWILGSSEFGAQLAAQLSLPYAFASHFAPDYMHHALNLYRRQFQPSEHMERPYAMIIGVNLFAADTDDEGRRLFTSLQQQFVNLVRNRPAEVPPPVDSMDGLWNPAEQQHVERMTRISAVGSPPSVGRQLQAILEETDADELILTGQIYDHAARLRSFEIAADLNQTANWTPWGSAAAGR
jgi:luciferase family oxidoreductase group 1